jgi:mRNA interferase HigB
MRVIGKARLRRFWEQYPDSRHWLLAWYKTALAADGATLADVRETYPHADGVTLYCGLLVTVFNVRGNKYRLITRIIYEFRRVYVKLVLTHAGYSRENWKVQLCQE